MTSAVDSGFGPWPIRTTKSSAVTSRRTLPEKLNRRSACRKLVEFPRSEDSTRVSALRGL